MYLKPPVDSKVKLLLNVTESKIVQIQENICHIILFTQKKLRNLKILKTHNNTLL